VAKAGGLRELRTAGAKIGHDFSLT
jgi:hypothetical protein